MSKPQATMQEILKIVKANAKLFPGGVDAWPVKLVGIRGYYLDSMGVKGKNDIGIYDDALFLISANHFSSYNANVDPSVSRKKVATLEAGQFVRYKKAMHRAGTPGGHMALRQDSPVIVSRSDYDKPAGFVDDERGVALGGGRWTDKGWKGGIFAINIHKGGSNGTSSLGCQTIKADQWPAFFTAFSRELDRTGAKHIGYVLIEDPRMKK